MPAPKKSRATEGDERSAARKLRRSVVGRVYDVICERIATGVFTRDERLTEISLTRELKVSRGTVREAINKLAADGVIELIPHKGAVVRGLTRQDLADFLQIRGLFESFAARRAAERINEPGSRDQVLEGLQEVERLIEHPAVGEFVAHDSAFHSLVMDLSGNAVMAAEWRRLRRSRYRVRYLENLGRDEMLVSLGQHRDLLLAILDGEAERAAELAAQHVKLTLGRIQRLPIDRFNANFNPEQPARLVTAREAARRGPSLRRSPAGREPGPARRALRARRRTS